MSTRALVVAVLLVGCATGDDADPRVAPGGDASTETADVTDAELTLDTADAASEAITLDPDAACASTATEANVEVLPVDIIWMVDNSASMEPAVTELKAGLNSFASLIASKKLDYKVIMLSLRSRTSPITVSGSTRYPVCIPAPLAGDNDCGNGPRFFHSHVDIRSTQPLEQFLGTLDQTDGYRVGQERGAEPWKAQLRPSASKTIVIVTDDDARLSATDFETFAGGKNPFNSFTLPPGILAPARAGMFSGYLFAGLYGWGSESDPSVKCKFPDGSQPASAGGTYTTLVKKTGGPRAQLCAGKAAWASFFDAVASAVAKSAKLACELALPTPTSGTLDPSAVNVRILGATGEELIPKVASAGDCAGGAGWYYDSESAPTRVLLCPATCDAANAAVGVDKPGKIEVLFGCKSVIK